MSYMSRVLEREAREQRKARNRLISVVVILLILCTATHTAAILYAHKTGFQAGQEYERSLPKPKPVAAPAQLIECSRNGLDELLRLCRAQRRMERVGVK